MARTRLYRVASIQPHTYYFHGRAAVCVIERRQHNWVLIQKDGTEQLVAAHELRQCKCPLAGRFHWHDAPPARADEDGHHPADDWNGGW